MSKDYYSDFFLGSSLFSGLSSNSLKALYAISQEVFLKKGECLMQEGDASNEVYFILEGNLEVVKCDAETNTNHTINYLYPGDCVGELTLFNHTHRSASIYAVTEARLLKIDSQDLDKLSKKKDDISTVYFEISKRTSQRLRETTEMAAVALKRQLEEYKKRADIGRILVCSIIILSLVSYSILPLKHVLAVVSNTSYISIPMIALISVIVFLFIYSSRLPLYVFGVTMQNWKTSVKEGFFFTLPVLGVCILLKWFAIHFFPNYQGHQVFEPFLFERMDTLQTWILGNLIYCLFIPVQELLARGVLQGLLERFLIGKHKVLTSILVSNLIFASAHIFLSETISFIVFAAGLYFGWLYSRTHNLLGVILAHCMVGVWGLSVVGMIVPK